MKLKVNMMLKFMSSRTVHSSGLMVGSTDDLVVLE